VSIPQLPGGQFPLPEQWLPGGTDPEGRPFSPELQAAMTLVQKNMERISLGIGSNTNTIAPTALTGLYSTTWTDYTGTAGFTPYYGKRSGLVFMGGAVTKSPTTTFPGSAQTMFTMPAGFRPASTEQYLQLAVGGAGGAPTTGAVIIQIAATGVVTFISGLTGGGLTNNMAYISLSGITYGAAA